MGFRLVTITTALALCFAAHAAPGLYRMTDLGPGLAYGLNSQGDVVGIRADTYEAFVLPSGCTRSYLGRYTLDPCDINDRGRTMGYYFYESSDSRSYSWLWLGGNLLRLTDPGYSRGWALNNRDQVVGEYEPGFCSQAFVWSAADGLANLGTLGGSTSRAYGINDAGEIVGLATDAEETPRMFRWRDGTGMQDLGGIAGMALDINNAGQIVAFGGTSAGYGAQLYESGVFKLLPTTAGRIFTPRRINNAGVIVGNTSNSIPVVWDSVNGVRKVNDVVDPATNPGITVRYVYDINDRGDIAGYGWGTDGVYHAVLLKGGAAEDLTPPVIEGLTADPATLWPPNGEMHRVTVAYELKDDCDPAPKACIAISCNQTIGEGEAIVVDDHHVSLVAKRDGNDKNGRIYTITLQAKDQAGNIATASVTVTVPHDAAKGKANGRGVVAAAAAPARGGTVSIVASVSGPCELRATVLNMAGRCVRVLDPVTTETASVTLLWNGRSDTGTKVPAGRYLVRVESFSADGSKATVMAPLQMIR